MMSGTTEARHERAEGLDGLPSRDVLAIILDSHLSAAECVRSAIGEIAKAAALAAEKLQSGGRLIYAGAGSSGLMALADGLELPGTFGLSPEQVKIILAGGVDGLVYMAGGYEDDVEQAAKDFDAIGINETDCVICTSASGTTPYALAAARTARTNGASVIGIANNSGALLFSHADVAILLETPAEVVAGSTRMGAGTAQKIALNMLSTLMAIRLGHVHDGYMVNLRADNIKLQDRACRIVSQISGAGMEDAAHYLKLAGGSVKVATLIAAGADGAETASRMLASCNQNLRQALEMARAGS